MRNIRWQKMALRAANGLLDGVTALLVLLAVVWSGYALWDNSRVYAAADNVQAGLLAFKPQPQEDNSLSFGQLRDINPDVCGWLTLDGTAIDYPVVQGESNFTYLNTDVYGSFWRWRTSAGTRVPCIGAFFLDVDCKSTRRHSSGGSVGVHRHPRPPYGERADVLATSTNTRTEHSSARTPPAPGRRRAEAIGWKSWPALWCLTVGNRPSLPRQL